MKSTQKHAKSNDFQEFLIEKLEKIDKSINSTNKRFDGLEKTIRTELQSTSNNLRSEIHDRIEYLESKLTDKLIAMEKRLNKRITLVGDLNVENFEKRFNSYEKRLKKVERVQAA